MSFKNVSQNIYSKWLNNPNEFVEFQKGGFDIDALPEPYFPIKKCNHAPSNKLLCVLNSRP